MDLAEEILQAGGQLELPCQNYLVRYCNLIPHQWILAFIRQIPFNNETLYHCSHLLCWSSGGGATTIPPRVLYMGVSYSRKRAHGELNPTQSIPIE